MRPIFGTEQKSCVNTDYGSIPWDVENDRVIDYTGEAGRLYAQALEENDMTYPDDYVAPPEVPPVPTVEQQVLFDHENRVRALEGVPPIEIEAFMSKRINFKG